MLLPHPSRVRWLTALSPAARGRLWMLFSGVCFALMIAAVRHVAEEVHPFETAFFRNLFGLLFMLPFFLRAGPSALRTTRPGLHALRSVLQAVYMLTTFYAVTLIPLADFTALSFSAPLFAAIGAILLLNEKAHARRLAVLVIGFAGVLIVLRPGVTIVDPGALLVVGASAIWATCLLIIKSLSRTDSSVTITAYFAISMTVFTFVPALFVWQWPTLEQLLWLAFIGVMGNSAHMALAQAFRTADAGAVMPLDFLRLVWASALGYLVFAQTPDVWTWIGGAVIFSSATYLALREMRAEAVGARGSRSGTTGR